MIGPSHGTALAAVLALAIGSPPARAAEPTTAPIVIAPPRPVRAAPAPEAIERARAAYDLASKSFYGGRVAAALPHALAAWDAVANSSSALIVATVLAELGRPCDALPYLVHAAELDPTEAEHELALTLLADEGPRCAPGYGWARVTTSPADAAMTLAGVELVSGRTVVVAAGQRALAVSAPGHEAHGATVDVTAGRGMTLHVALAKTLITATPIAVAVTTPQASSDDTAGWVLVGSGAAALVAGGICFGVALGEADRGEAIVARAARSSLPPTPEDERALADSHARTEAFEAAGWIAGGVGIVATAIGVVLLATGDDAPGDTWTREVRLGADGGVLVLGRRF